MASLTNHDSKSIRAESSFATSVSESANLSITGIHFIMKLLVTIFLCSCLRTLHVYCSGSDDESEGETRGSLLLSTAQKYLLHVYELGTCMLCIKFHG